MKPGRLITLVSYTLQLTSDNFFSKKEGLFQPFVEYIKKYQIYNSHPSTFLFKMGDRLLLSSPFSFMSFPPPFMSFPRKRESIILRDELGGFKEPKDLLQLPEITNLEWEEWAEEGIVINVQ